jgi:ATP-binding cassette subfamily C protein
MILAQTLRDFWRLMDAKGRLTALVLVAFLIASSVIEIAGVMFVFGYITVLGEGAGQGPAHSPAAQLGIVHDIFVGLAGSPQGEGFALRGGAVLVAVFVLKNAIWFFANFALIRFAMKQYERVAGGLFDGYQNMPLAQLRADGSSEPMRIIGSVLMVFRRAFTPLLQAFADAVVILAMLAALLILADPALVIGAGLLIGAVMFAFLAATRKLSQALGERVLAAQRMLDSVSNEALRGMIDVRLAGRQDQLRNRFGLSAGEFALADRRVRALTMGPRILNELVLALGIALAAAWFATQPGGLAGSLAVLAVMAFAGLRVTSAASRLTQQVQGIHEVDQARQRMMSGVEQVAPGLLRHTKHVATSRIFDRGDPLPDGASRMVDRLEARGVSFTYPGTDEPAIRETDLVIPAGAFHALCGPSGGGKTTLSLLLTGLLTPDKGTVTFDGHDIARHMGVWHDQIGYVGQTPFLLPGSVRDNVAIGSAPGEISDDAIWQALEAARVDDVFRRHPDGLDAGLGEDGAKLSGGQRQRVAIARALVRNPAVLIFDEATAALDTVTEREVSAAISGLRGDRTIIVIAHRISTIRNAETIHYVADGSIMADGTYDRLMQSSPAFRSLAV